MQPSYRVPTHTCLYANIFFGYVIHSFVCLHHSCTWYRKLDTLMFGETDFTPEVLPSLSWVSRIISRRYPWFCYAVRWIKTHVMFISNMSHHRPKTLNSKLNYVFVVLSTNFEFPSMDYNQMLSFVQWGFNTFFTAVSPLV